MNTDGEETAVCSIVAKGEKKHFQVLFLKILFVLSHTQDILQSIHMQKEAFCLCPEPGLYILPLVNRTK